MVGWSVLIDILLAIIGIAAVINGFRSGLLGSAAGLVGLVLGGLAAFLATPWVIKAIPSPEWRAPAAIVTSLVLLTAGAWAGQSLGRVLRRGARAIRLGTIDRILGVLGSLLVAAFISLLVASGIQVMGVPALSQALAGSTVLTTLNNAAPEPVRQLLSQVRSATIDQALPWIVNVLDSPTKVPVVPNSALETPEIVEAEESIVRITGAAYNCGYSLSGSGFVIAPERVLTNAHVIAGVDRPVVEPPGEIGRKASVVAIDNENDLAVLSVPGLGRPPLSISDTPTPGTQITVAGYPFGGPFSLRAAEIIGTGPVTIQTAGKTATRDVTTIAAKIDHGNSGGPLLSAKGKVLGVVFAKSEQNQDVGYAVPVAIVNPLVSKAPELKKAVKTGSCVNPAG